MTKDVRVPGCGTSDRDLPLFFSIQLTLSPYLRWRNCPSVKVLSALGWFTFSSRSYR